MIDTTNCNDYFRATLDAAKALGPEAFASLEDRLAYLGEYACRCDSGIMDPEKTRCVLYKDFALLSFGFVMLRRSGDGTYQPWFNGGLIYYGDSDHRWGVHT